MTSRCSYRNHLYVTVGGLLAVAIVTYVLLSRGPNELLTETAVSQIRSIAGANSDHDKEYISLESVISRRLAAIDTVDSTLDLSSLPVVAARSAFAIVSADWDALVASLGDLPLQPDHELARHLREQWRLLPPRHRPEHLEELSDLEILALRTRDTKPLQSIDVSRIDIRVFDIRERAQSQAAAALFGRRYGDLLQGDSSLTMEGDISMRPLGLPPLRESPYSHVAVVDIPGKSQEGNVVVLSIKLFYYEPFGWVPTRVESITIQSAEAPTPYTPRI